MWIPKTFRRKKLRVRNFKATLLMFCHCSDRQGSLFWKQLLALSVIEVFLLLCFCSFCVAVIGFAAVVVVSLGSFKLSLSRCGYSLCSNVAVVVVMTVFPDCETM